MRPVVSLLLALSLLACSDGSITTSNTAPQAVILAPAVGTSIRVGSSLLLRGTVQDDTTAPTEMLVVWASSIDGTLGEAVADSEGFTELSVSALSTGAHTLSLRVVDSDGASGSATVDLDVTDNAAPSVEIQLPSVELARYADAPFAVRLLVADGDDPLADLRVDWSVGELAGGDALPPSASGLIEDSVQLPAGSYTLQATVTDPLGRTGTDILTFPVGPANGAPTCSIDAPASAEGFAVGAVVLFEGQVGDEQDADTLIVEWSSSLDGVLGTSTASSDGEVLFAASGLSAGAHTVTLSVEDELLRTCADNVIVYISNPPTAEILTPGPGTFALGSTLSFNGEVHDGDQPDSTLIAVWTSDLDGVLSTSAPDSGGALAFNRADLTAGTHLITLTATDEAGLSTTDTVTLVVDAPPSQPIPALNPPNPITTQSLLASLQTPSVDPEGGSVSYAWSWTKDGVAQPAWNGQTSVPAAFTTRGDVWQVSVTASDGFLSSLSGTASVTVDNAAPSAQSAAVSPTYGTPTTSFSVVATGWSDADGDSPSWLYQWTLDGIAQIGATGPSFVPIGSSSGDLVGCAVTPWDGWDLGAPIAATPGVIDSEPLLASMGISPGAGTEATTFSALPGATSDPDGQAVTVSVQWYVNGSPAGTATTLSGTAFDRDDAVFVRGTPNDGLVNGAPVDSATVVIANTAPTNPQVAIDPPSPVDPNDDLVCVVTGSSSDLDGDAISYLFSWSVDGVPWSGAVATTYRTGDTIVAAQTDPGEDWTCTAVATDGTASSGMDGDTVTIQAGCTGVTVQVEGISGLIPVCTNCTVGQYSCQAQAVCQQITGTTCVWQQYDCGYGTQGSWYPSNGQGSSTFNFAYAYDWYPGVSGYGNICDCNPDETTVLGLYRGHTYCGTGHWYRQ